MKNLKEEISVPEYEKMYHKMLEEVARKNFHAQLYAFALQTILIAVGIVLIGAGVYRLYGILAVVFLVGLFTDKLRLYKYKNYKVEEGVVSIERLKEIFREQRKNTTKGFLLTFLGTLAFVVVVLASFNYTLHGFSPGAIQGYVFLVIFFIVMALSAVTTETRWLRKLDVDLRNERVSDDT
ncbi:MAG: hypothetical protein DDT29_02417 [Dehalococcoidia bacterium]|nr:hypothetical protein [Bacillota bacterium]